MVRDIIATIRDLEYQRRQFDALTQRVRGGVEKEIRRHNELWEPIDRVWTDIDDPKFDQPQPVNLTPGALGVRCEE